MKIALDGVKRRWRTLASDETVCPLSSQNLNHTEHNRTEQKLSEHSGLTKIQIYGWGDSIHIRLTRYWSYWSLSLMPANLSKDDDFSES